MSIGLDLSGKTALVTGGSRGIGRECSKRLAAAGANVIVNYHKSEEKVLEVVKEIREAGGEAEPFRADIAKLDEVQALFTHIREKYGRLDVLVNNAGIIRDMLLLSMELSDWDRVMDLNLKGAFLCTKFAAEIMMPQHAGKIINISSIGAIKCGRGQSNYAAAKGGLISFTRACAVELSGKGIQVNAVLPGMIETDMSRRVRKLAGDAILKSIPAGRYGVPADIANMVVFLASDLSDYICGQAISVDGGMSVS
ncbi:MAG: 3-oxoacyl-ACP reductase FabG [Nitrospirae bacterium]|nr:3-oxoacyl-ACP reductase FabG [Nitrospirota bacterium]